jgi:hypothetical protein
MSQKKKKGWVGKRKNRSFYVYYYHASEHSLSAVRGAQGSVNGLTGWLIN